MGSIYLVTNMVNGKRYVGKTKTSLRQRWSNHCNAARTGSKQLLQKAIRKYGEERFLVVEIDSHENESELYELEKKWIAALGTRPPNGYNATDGGIGFLGGKHSEKTLTVMRKRVNSIETREKISLANTGRRFSAEVRARMSQSAKGKKLSEETRRKISMVQIGKKIPDAVKEKIRAKHLGRPMLETTKEKLGLLNRGIKRSDETFIKMRNSARTRGNCSSLTEEIVGKILTDTRIRREISSEYNVPVSAIFKIQHGQTWNDVLPEVKRRGQ
jgi:group I intron endonuclease